MIPRQNQYRSRLEQEYAGELEKRRLAGTLDVWRYEGITFRLPGGARYTPDFFTIEPNGRMCVVEVKGWSRSIARSRLAWKVAASQWPCFEFLWITKGRSGWNCEGFRRDA